MKVVTLIENETIDPLLKSAHGLSLYIESNNKKILFDVGPNKNVIKNAKKLNIDLAAVDMVFISHGHYDHGRGVHAFMKINDKATIYMSTNAFNKLYKKVGPLKLPIGIRKPSDLDRFHFVDIDEKITDNIKVYTSVKYKKELISDKSLLTKENGSYEEDHFDHEMYLVIDEPKTKVLFSGCSHKGIENIIKSIETKEHTPFTDVIAGFHLSRYDKNNDEETAYLHKLGHELRKRNTTYYSCHCTGDEAYDVLHEDMDESLHQIKTGTKLNL